MYRRSKTWAVILTPIVFSAFVGCGGDDSPPPLPPLSQQPSLTSEIVCADNGLTAALQKCKDALMQALPAIMQAPDQGQAMAIALQAQQAGAKATQAALQQVAAADQAQIQQQQQQAQQQQQQQ